MEIFPPRIKASVSSGYTLGGQNKVNYQQVQGGLPLTMQAFNYAPTFFNVSIDCSPLAGEVFQDFYYSRINSGADEFIFNLDSGSGVLPHIVRIDEESLNFDHTRWPIVLVTFTLKCKKVPDVTPIEGLQVGFESAAHSGQAYNFYGFNARIGNLSDTQFLDTGSNITTLGVQEID